MSETVDKVADKLMASIQKSQNSTDVSKSKNTNSQNVKSTAKGMTTGEPGVKKIIDEMISPSSIESPRKFNRNLRWPD